MTDKNYSLRPGDFVSILGTEIPCLREGDDASSVSVAQIMSNLREHPEHGWRFSEQDGAVCIDSSAPGQVVRPTAQDEIEAYKARDEARDADKIHGQKAIVWYRGGDGVDVLVAHGEVLESETELDSYIFEYNGLTPPSVGLWVWEGWALEFEGCEDSDAPDTEIGGEFRRATEVEARALAAGEDVFAEAVDEPLPLRPYTTQVRETAVYRSTSEEQAVGVHANKIPATPEGFLYYIAQQGERAEGKRCYFYWQTREVVFGEVPPEDLQPLKFLQGGYSYTLRAVAVEIDKATGAQIRGTA